MTRLVVVAAALLASAASAQIFSGGRSRAAFQTEAALNLYVATTGSDSNPCTSSLNPCATLQAAENRIPKLVRHPVTITVADGSYTGLYVYGHSFDPASVTDGAYINWVGGLINATVATGSATGTATSGTQGTTITFGTLTDTNATWTTDNLKGKILEITGGTGSGQTRVITTNSATAITIAGTWGTAPAAASTYAIRDWGAVLSTAVNSPAIPNTAAGTPLSLRMEGNGSVRNAGDSATTLSGAAITFSRLKFAPGTAAQGAARLNGPNQVAFVECSINGNTSGTGLSVLFGTYVNIDRSYLSSGTSQALLGSSTNGGSNAVAAGFSFFESGAGASSSVVRYTNGAWTAVQITSTNSAAQAVIDNTNNGPATFSIGNSRIQCTAGGATIGVLAAGAPAVASTVTVTFVAAMATLSCPVGLNAKWGATIANNNANSVVTGTGAQTAGLQALTGGRIIPVSNFTVSGYTNDIDVDGAFSTWAALVALTPVVFPAAANAYGSWVGR